MSDSFLRQLLLNGYYGATLPYRHWANRRRCANGLAPLMVLFYHRIADDRANGWTHSNQLFLKQIRWLQRHCELVSLEEAQRRMRNVENDRPTACITFDDGYAENCDQAIPLLIDENIPCTYFVSSAHVLDGKRFPHDIAVGCPGHPNTVEQLREMAKCGIEIGAHTRNHADLGPIHDEIKLYDEVVVAGEELQEAIGKSVRYFAFPFGLPGNLNARAFQIAFEYGYEAVCSAYGAYNFPGDDPFHLRRIHVDNMVRLKNWCSVDPRHLRRRLDFDYERRAIRRICDSNREVAMNMATVLDAPADKCDVPNSAAAQKSTSAPVLKTDTLAQSVVVLLLLAAVQRIMGFLRGVLVCRWLSPDELGQWDMAFGFLTLAAPLTVLGLPGSFGRYVEYFRQRGQLRVLVRRTAIACGALTALAVVAISLARPLISEIVFGRSEETELVLFLAVTLAIVIAFNYLTELLTALRMARVAGIVQFFNSLAFAGFSVLFLLGWRREASSLVAAYGIACALQIGWMIWYLRHQLQYSPADAPADRSDERGAFWSKLLSFATWVWVSNLLYNLFDVADRYMIVHTSTANDPLAIVGSYHSSRIVPLLLVSVASLMGTMILPHLSHDWEAGKRREVSDRMNVTLKLLGLLLFVGSIAILLAAPFLFDIAFQGKFARGKSALPWTLTYCSWFGLVTVAQLYLWCAERPRLSCLALLLGLATNVVLNSILLPHFGLLGAVWATAVANFVALVLILRFNAWLGMKIQRSMLLVTLLPISLGLGPMAALSTLVAVILAIYFTDQILSHDEKRRLADVWHGYAGRFSRLKTCSANTSLERSSNRPLRVIFVITSMHVGGAEILLYNLIRRLDRTRFSPELCCLKERGTLGEQLAEEIPVYSNLLRRKYDFRVLRKLNRLLRKREIDAVITVGAGDKMFWGRLAARRAKVPVVISALHSTGWPDGINWLNRRLTLITDAFVAVAEPHARHLIEVEHLPAARVHVISNGVDTEKFRPQPGIKRSVCQSLGIPRTAPLVGIVAVLRPEKNHELFLRTAARVRRDIPEAHFLIVGDGPRRPVLERLAADLQMDNCVHFLGQRIDIPEILSSLDVFALTSHNEANPVSILEALASGKPVVSTRVGSICETVVDDKTGYLVEPGNELEMSKRVTELLLDPAKAQRLGAAARRLVVSKWSIQAMVAGYEDLITSVHSVKTDRSNPSEAVEVADFGQVAPSHL